MIHYLPLESWTNKSLFKPHLKTSFEIATRSDENFRHKNCQLMTRGLQIQVLCCMERWLFHLINLNWWMGDFWPHKILPHDSFHFILTPIPTLNPNTNPNFAVAVKYFDMKGCQLKFREIKSLVWFPKWLQNTGRALVTSIITLFNQIELDGVISGGKSLFTNLAPSCFHAEELIEATKNYKVYTNHEDFVQVLVTVQNSDSHEHECEHLSLTAELWEKSQKNIDIECSLR